MNNLKKLEQIAYASNSIREVYEVAEAGKLILIRTEETAPSGMEILIAREDFALVRNCEDHFNERNSTEVYINPYGTNVAIRVKE